MKTILILLLTLATLAPAQSTGDFIFQRKTATGYAPAAIPPETGKVLGWSGGAPVNLDLPSAPPNNAANHKIATTVSQFQKTSIFMLGDSMIGTAIQRLRGATTARFGYSGMGLMDAGISGGAVIEADACVKWITGNTYKLSAATHVVTFGSDTSFPVTGNTLKIYYLRQPGGGNFKIETETSSVWGAEAAYASVATDGAIAGQVITITKTNYKAAWRIRCTWVTGGTNGPVNIIGAGVRDTNSNGALLTATFNGSTAINNINNAATTARAITDPIMADIAPTVILLSHLDGADSVNSSQATLQDNLTAGSISTAALPPSWVIVGPPVGGSQTTDTLNAAQAAAQKAIATARDDAFFDNRTWAMPYSSAVSNGYILDGTHYTARAQAVWIPAMFDQIALENTTYAGPAAPVALDFLGGGTISGTLNSFNGASQALFMSGGLRLGYGQFLLEDIAGPTSANDGGSIAYDGNAFKFGIGFTNQFQIDSPIGTLQIYHPSSTAAIPNGNLGIINNPFRALNLGKTINANTILGDQTINKATARVWFDIGDQSNTYTNPLVAADSIILATVIGNDPTASAVRVDTLTTGAFTLTLNAAPTAKTAVNFWVMP